jgi:hypothetical protein
MSTPQWRKSSHSHGDNTDCVEVAKLPRAIGLRDSKNPTTGHHTISRQAFARLMTTLKADSA